ncbi:flagellin [Thalassomonas actiniarum]|uniref:Flagellin n=1 Tax=Thalassomonas actiniarum TaxID=485447 RepID=A0AAE9YRE9_9GAMM|nr:flagellin [Thalassomonas actiniarum]WDD99312.1 Lateral flagellin [Thalassomonas actiniarum]
MALSIHTNYASLVTQNQLGKTNSMLSTAMERLGTGLRINSAADDAAGLQIAVRLQSQSNGQQVAMRNAQDAISMLQTGEGAFDEITNITHRMKDLATQASNSTNGDTERKSLNDEFQQLKEELGNILGNTEYGSGNKLFASTGTAATLGTAAVAGAPGTASTLDSGVVTFSNQAGFAAGGGLNFQIGASTSERMNVDVADLINDISARVDTLGAIFNDEDTITNAGNNYDTQSYDSATDTITVVAGTSNETMALAAMDNLDSLLAEVGDLRGQFGASINRLDHTINNLGNMNQNIELSKGRIMDADFASESSSMTKNQMLMQSGMSVLSNANQISGMVTSLLR